VRAIALTRPAGQLSHTHLLRSRADLLASLTLRSSSRHEWSRVILGMWQKYPNPATSHVISVDTIDRTVDPVTGIIRSCVRPPFRSAFALLGVLGMTFLSAAFCRS